MSNNILTNARIRSCTKCVNDRLARKEYSFSTPSDFLGFESTSNLSCRLVDSGYFFAVTTSTSAYVSQDNEVSIDASLYTHLYIDLCLDPPGSTFPTTGKFQFKAQADGEWDADKYVEFDLEQDRYRHTYSVDLSSNVDWQGTVSNFRVYPIIGGTSGTKVFIRKIYFESNSVYKCQTGTQDTLCDKYAFYENPCPFIGSPGKVSVVPGISNLSIVQGINDFIYINIDDYGFKKIVLDSGTAIPLRDISIDIERKLQLVSIGGYSAAACYFDGTYLEIFSGVHSGSSTVRISQEGPLTKQLGFYSDIDVALFTATTGTDSASLYERAPLRLTSSDFMNFFEDSGSNIGDYFTVGLDKHTPSAGNPLYSLFSRESKLSFGGYTLIDINNPVTDYGILRKVYYSGDLFTDTSLCVYRRRLNGTIVLIESVSLGEVSEVQDTIVEKSCVIDVNKGDFIGLYSAALHTGTENTRENLSYFLLEGFPETILEEPNVNGNGLQGVPLYCRGVRIADEGVIDIEFDSVQPVEALNIFAEFEDSEEAFNLCLAKSGGLSGGVFVDTATGTDLEGATSPEMENTISLIDGIKYETNGQEEYCYPGWLDLPPDQQDNYDYTDFSIEIDFIRGVPVLFDISKVILYFVDERNIKSFKLETPVSFSLDGLSKVWDTVCDSYSAVYTDNYLADSDLYLYSNPSVVTAEDYHNSYQILKYRKLELNFDSKRTRSIKYSATYGSLLNTDTGSADYSYFPIAPSPKITEIEAYFSFDFANSVSGNFFVESSVDGETFLRHNDVDLVLSGQTRCVVGRPSKIIRLNMSSEQIMRVSSITATPSASNIEFSGDSFGTIKLNPPLSNYSNSISTVVVENNGAHPASYYIDIDNSINKGEKCILWNKLNSTGIVNSEIGSGASVTSRDTYNIRPNNYAHKCPSYFVNKFFDDSASYVSYDGGSTCQSLGKLLVDGNIDTYITNESEDFHAYPLIYIYIDFGESYYLDGLSQEAPSGFSAFNDTVLYSSSSNTDPCSIASWSAGGLSNVRWARLSVSSVYVGYPSVRKLAYVGIHANVFNNRKKGIWKSCGTGLTDGISSYTNPIFSFTDSTYYCVDLGWFYNVTGVFRLPLPSGWDYDDLYSAEPGDTINLLGTSFYGSEVAFSTSNVSDISRVSWAPFGARPSSNVRWVLVKSPTSLGMTEIVVHCCENDAANKLSIFNSNWWSSIYSSVSKEYSIVKNGICSTRFDYAKDVGEAVDTVSVIHDFGVDSVLARRDYLSFWFYVSDLSQLDSSYGYFKLGILSTDPTVLDFYSASSSTKYYSWNISEIFSAGVENGWNFIRLPLSDGYKVGTPYLVSDDPEKIGSTITRDRLNSLELSVKVVSDNSAFFICVDDFKILRNDFAECHFGEGVYLSGEEHAMFLMEEFDPRKGTIEMWLRPDWSKSPFCNSCDDVREHTILQVHGSGIKFDMLLFMTGEGLKYYIYDGETSYFVIDNSSTVITQDSPTHIAITWDLDAVYGDKLMSIFINNTVTANLNASTSACSFLYNQSGVYTLTLGGVGWEGLMSSLASSADAILENIKVYNYPVNDFTRSMQTQGLYFPKRPSDLVEISLDGTTFYSNIQRDAYLPLVVQNVPAGTSFNVYIRPTNLECVGNNEKNRKSYIKIDRILV
jgi:hypothetical protein